MKILTLFLLISLNAYSQDTTRTPIGYDIDASYLHARIDTIHSHATIAHFYHRKAYVSINGGKASLLRRGEYITAWNIHPIVVITRKKFKYNYQL